MQSSSVRLVSLTALCPLVLPLARRARSCDGSVCALDTGDGVSAVITGDESDDGGHHSCPGDLCCSNSLMVLILNLN